MGTLGGGSFQAAGAVATDPHGFVFLVDGDVVRRFYPDGTLCETITGGFRNPGGVAVDQYRNLYVADTDNHRVQIFFPDQMNGGSDTYTHHWSFGSRGAAPGDFDRPRGLAVIPSQAVDGEELLAVADTDNHRVQLFRLHVSGLSADVSRRAQAITGINPVSHAVVSGPGMFTTPVGVACDRQRRLYVCDSGLNRVSRFTPNADATAFADQVDWGLAAGAAGAGPREFNTPRSIAVDLKHGHLYVADAGNRRVQRLNAESGGHLADWAPALPAPFAPESVAVDARGEVYVSDAANKRVVRGTPFEAAGARRADTAAPAQVGAPWTPVGDPAHMRGPAYAHFAADGKLWVSDTDNDRVLTFERNPAGVLVLAAGRIDAGLDGPVGIAIDPEGGVFVADSGNNRIRRYGAALAHAADLGTPGVGDGQLADPRGLAVAQRVEPMLYVADRGNDRVQVLRRDGTFAAKLLEGDGRRMSAPEDVAVDAAGAVYVADTGNGRVLRYTVGVDGTHAFSRAIPVPVKVAGTTPAPSGVSTDRDGNLLVTDREQNLVLLMETDGDLLAYWDLRALVQMDVDAGELYYPGLARLQTFRRPARAVVDDRGLLAVADAGNDRVRLVRIHTEIHANLYDLGEGLPDVSFRAVTKADWREELGLKVNVGDVSIFDETQDFVSDPESDFAGDELDRRWVLGRARGTSSAVEVLKTTRMVQKWYQHQTRQDEADHRWGPPGGSRTLNVDLISGGSYQFLDVNLGEDPHGGRGSDAWDAGVVAHEMTHWVFYKACEPLPPFTLVGLFELMRSHQLSLFITENQALSEGWASYVGNFWGVEYGATDRVRGIPMGLNYSLDNLHPAAGQPDQYLFGGDASLPLPTFDQPGRGVRSEGYIANALYQIHRALTDPSVVFADAPAYWHRYNASIGDEQSRRYSVTIWKALRRFPSDPPMEDMDRASTVYLRNVLAQFRAELPDFAEMAQSIFELNNLLMPVITITEGTSDTGAGAAIGDTVGVHPGQTRSLIIRVTDATGMPLRGYNLKLTVGAAANYALRAGTGPTPRHGRGGTAGATELYRATNASGIVNVTFTAPALVAPATSATETLRVTYQPDFDTDAAFTPPEHGDDRETTLRRLYLHELRTAAKTWGGTGNNFGAEVRSRTVTFNVTPA